MALFENIFTEAAVQKLGWSLVHFIWQAAAIALLLAIVLSLLRKASANLRYTIACSTLAFIALLPVVTMQFVSVPAAPAEITIEPESQNAGQTAAMESQTTVTISSPPVESTPAEIIASVKTVSWKQKIISTLEPVLQEIVSIWLIGVFALSLWHLGGWTKLQRLRTKTVRPVNSSLHAKMNLLSEKLGLKQAVRLYESLLVQIPTVVGWIKPVILLPASAISGLTTEQLEAILAHELAHIKRFDYLINILQTIVEILGFYHPAVWWVSHRIRCERENCCDDLAVSISGDRIRYAKALAQMEELRSGDGKLAVAAGGGNLFNRIRRLIGKDSSERTSFTWIPAAAAILLLITLAIPTTLALNSPRNQDPNQLRIEKMLLDGFRENRAKFERGFLAWTRTTINDGFSGPDYERYETKGSFQMWWDGKKISTHYVDEQLCRDSRSNRQWIETKTGGNVYDGGLLSRKPEFRSGDNWFERIIRWAGPFPIEEEIARMKKLKNVSLDWSIMNVDSEKQIKLAFYSSNKDDGRRIMYFDLSRGCNLIRDESYKSDGKLYNLRTSKLQQVGSGWFPVEVDRKIFNTEGKVIHNNHFALDLSRCSFNNPDAIPQGIFEYSTAAEDQKLKEILEKYSKETTTDNDNNVKIICESVENYISAALAGEDEKAAEYVFPGSAVAVQTGDMREALQGSQAQIVAVFSGEWNALVISSVIPGDHGRTGPLIFLMKKEILDQKTRWMIDDIDLETLDSVEKEIEHFLEQNPEAKALILHDSKQLVPDFYLREPPVGNREEESSGQVYVITEGDYPTERGKASIFMDMQLLSVSESVLKKIETDVNSIKKSLIIDDRQVRNIIRTVEADKDSKILARPQLVAFEGKQVTIEMGDKDKLSPDMNISASKSIFVALFLVLKPTMVHDNNDVLLDCELKAVRPVKDVNLINNSESGVISFINKILQPIPKGQTLLINGGESPFASGPDRNKKRLLMLIKPNILSQTVTASGKSEQPLSAEQQREVSIQRLRRLGIALNVYAQENNNKLPENLGELKPYFANMEVYEWLLDNIEYPGKIQQYVVRQSHTIPLAFGPISPDDTDRINVLFMDGHVESVTLEKVKDLFGIDEPAKKNYETVVVEYVDAAEMTDRLNKSLDLQSQDDILLQPLPQAKQILIFGSDEKRQMVRKLIAETDREQSEASEQSERVTKVFKLNEYISPIWVAQSLKIILAFQAGNPSSPRPQDTSIADIRPVDGNCLLVTAAKTEIPRITQFIQALDSPPEDGDTQGSGSTITQIFALKNANSVQLAELLKLVFMNSKDATITSNASTKSLVVRANKSDIRIIEKLIDVFDNPQDQPETEQEVLEEAPVIPKNFEEISKRVESGRILTEIGKGMLLYGGDHEDKYPDSIDQLKNYITEEEFEWAMQNVSYLGGGKTMADPPDLPIAYDKTLLAGQNATDVFFNDAHVEFAEAERLKELYIIKEQIQIEARILTVSEEFYKDFGLDGNMPENSFFWPDPTPFSFPTYPFTTPMVEKGAQSFALNKQNVDFLLKAAPAYESNRILAAPIATVMDNDPMTLTINRKLPFISDFNEPKFFFGKPKPVMSEIQVGATIEVTPHVRFEQQDILLKLKFEHSWVPNVHESMYKNKYKRQSLAISRRTSEFQFALPPGQALVYNTGLKTFYEEEKKLSELENPLNYRLRPGKKALLILLTPTILTSD